MTKDERHAPILIATSFQALNRALSGRRDTQVCDCAVVVLFAGLWVEANVNFLVHRLRKTREMHAFLERSNRGLGDKMAWYYNTYVARVKASSRKDFKRLQMHRKVRTRFPGFAPLCRFRNDLSHGAIHPIAGSVHETQRVRLQAKEIVKELYAIAATHGHHIAQPTDYYGAIEVARSAEPAGRAVGRGRHV